MRLQRAFCALLLLSCSVIGSPASGQQLRPGIIDKDDRVRVDSKGPPWDAIGQVNISGYRRLGACTGTLVAPDLVLTAAHCVMDQWKQAPHPLHHIHFLAGVRGPKHKGHATAKCLRFLPDYRPLPAPRSRSKKSFSTEAFMQDVVIIELSKKLAVETASLAEGLKLRRGLKLIHAAYSADRRYALSAHFGCRLNLMRPDEGLLYTSCDTHPASSGGPLLVQGDDNKLKVAAILLGGDISRSVGLSISKWLQLIKRPACS